MLTVVVIIIALYLLFLLSKLWIWIVRKIMDPIIEKAEAKAKEELKNNPEYQFWVKAEELLGEFKISLDKLMEQPSTQNGQDVNPEQS